MSFVFFFFSSRRRHTRFSRDWSSDVCSSDLPIFERINRQYPLAGRRWTLEHMSTTRRKDLERLRDFGIGVTLIPDFHLWKVGYRSEERRVGKECRSRLWADD